jgi:hypothetical protein
MILVREYKTSDKLKLKRKERKYIQKLRATLNCTIPTRTKKELYNENQDEIEKKRNNIVKQTKTINKNTIKHIINTIKRLKNYTVMITDCNTTMKLNHI